MSRCYSCKKELTEENRSAEHIIPNSIGGWLKSKDLLCKTCNSLIGDKIDAALAASLNALCGQLMIRRDRGKIPPVKNVKTESGELYHLENGRTPVLARPIIKLNIEENTFEIRARDKKEARHIVAQLKEKHPTLNTDNIESKFQEVDKFMNEKLLINFAITGDFLKAIVKIGVNAYLYQHGEIENVESCINALLHASEVPDEMLHHYYPEHLMTQPASEVTHTIIVKGDPNTKLLYAYVELFSSVAFIVRLNDNYNGNIVSWSYSYDVINNVEVNTNLDLRYDDRPVYTKSLNDLYIANLQKRLNRVFGIADKRQVEKTFEKIVSQSIQETIGKYPEGTIITEKMIDEYTLNISEKAAIFISHLRRNDRRKPKPPIDKS